MWLHLGFVVHVGEGALMEHFMYHIIPSAVTSTYLSGSGKLRCQIQFQSGFQTETISGQTILDVATTQGPVRETTFIFLNQFLRQ